MATCFHSTMLEAMCISLIPVKRAEESGEDAFHWFGGVDHVRC